MERSATGEDVDRIKEALNKLGYLHASKKSGDAPPPLSERAYRALAGAIKTTLPVAPPSCYLGFQGRRKPIELVGAQNTDPIRLGVIRAAVQKLAATLGCGEIRLRAALGLPTPLSAKALNDARSRVSEALTRLLGI